MPNPAFFANVSDASASREFMQWLQTNFDKPLGIILKTNDSVCPGIKKDGTIIWESESLNKVFIVHHDGTKKVFWEATGIDLY